MQLRPNHIELLQAVARFLEREVRPAIKDPALSFRVLIASNLAQVVAGELSVQDMASEAELTRLAELLPDAAGDIGEALKTREGRAHALDRLNRELIARLRASRFSDEERKKVWDHVMTTLRGELFTSSPRFDTSRDIE